MRKQWRKRQERRKGEEEGNCRKSREGKEIGKGGKEGERGGKEKRRRRKMKHGGGNRYGREKKSQEKGKIRVENRQERGEGKRGG